MALNDNGLWGHPYRFRLDLYVFHMNEYACCAQCLKSMFLVGYTSTSWSFFTSVLWVGIAWHLHNIPTQLVSVNHGISVCSINFTKTSKELDDEFVFNGFEWDIHCIRNRMNHLSIFPIPLIDILAWIGRHIVVLLWRKPAASESIVQKIRKVTAILTWFTNRIMFGIIELWLDHNVTRWKESF